MVSYPLHFPAFLQGEPDVLEARRDPEGQEHQSENRLSSPFPVKPDAEKKTDENRQGHLKAETAVIGQVLHRPNRPSFHSVLFLVLGLKENTLKNRVI